MFGKAVYFYRLLLYAAISSTDDGFISRNRNLKRRRNVNIYLLRQSRHEGYETYDSCVVAAANEDEARKIHPSGSKEYYESDWAKSNEIEVTLIGKAHKKINEPGVICASFNAG